MVWAVSAVFRANNKFVSEFGTAVGTIASEKYCDSLTGEVLELESRLLSCASPLTQSVILSTESGWFEDDGASEEQLAAISLFKFFVPQRLIA